MITNLTFIKDIVFINYFFFTPLIYTLQGQSSMSNFLLENNVDCLRPHLSMK